MILTVGTDSTWSLRAWICCKLSQLNFELNIIDLTQPNYKTNILKHSPSGLVPALQIDQIHISDSLAIAEYLNEVSLGVLYPTSISERAAARSLCAELHSGFQNLRAQCPFSLDSVKPLSALTLEMQNEISRIEAIFAQAQLPYMYKNPGVVDAFYSVLAFRLNSYGIKLNGKAGDYQQQLLHWPTLKQAISQARQWNVIRC